MLAKLLLPTICLLVALVGVGAAIPPLAPSTLPGSALGFAEAKWVFPYVRVLNTGVCPTGEHCGCCFEWNVAVGWYEPSGTLAREVTGPRVRIGAGFLREDRSDETVLHGLGAGWRLTFPADVEGRFVANPSGETLVHSHASGDSTLSLAVYRSERRVATLGPFARTKATNVKMSGDGSFAIFVGTDDPTVRELVVVDPQGRETFRVRCGPGADRPHAAPDGRGVLLRRRHHTAYHSADGTEVRLERDERFLAWVPGGEAVLLVDSGNPRQITRRDLRSLEEQKWAVDFRPAAGRHVAVFRDLLFLARHRDGRQTLDVLDLGDGRRVARWESGVSGSGPSGTLQVWRGRLYFLAGDEFSEVPVELMQTADLGWK